MRDGTLNFMLKTVDRAGQYVLQAFHHLGKHQVHEKRPGDFVSDVDLEAQQRIIEPIRRTFPDHAIVAEEMDGPLGPEDAEHQWIIDPIDGSNNFVRGLPHFALSVAHRYRGRTEHAIVFDPVRNEMFSAIRGKGAYLNDTRIRVNQRRQLAGSLVLSALPFGHRNLTPATLEVFQALYQTVQDIRISGSAALDLAWVAAGRADLYFETGLKPWDHAAGALLVREAAGLVTDLSGGEDWQEKGHLLAGNLKLNAQAAAVLKPLARALQQGLRAARD